MASFSLLRRAGITLGLFFVAACSTTTDAETTDQEVTTSVVRSKKDFFAPEATYFIRVARWDSNLMTPSSLADERTTRGSELRIYKAPLTSSQHCQDAEVSDRELVYKTGGFSVRTSGNFTNGTPKSSYKISLNDDDDRLFKMKAINLKSMWNDVSQMRESVAWSLFAKAGLAAPRHVYAKLCINDRYYGLYSLIEQVDKQLVKDHFGDNDKGNLYKAYWEDIGPATLERRVDREGNDSGKQYFRSSNMDKRTYQLKTNDKSDDPRELQTYDDLAALIRTINGVGVPGEGDAKFKSEAYKESLDNVLDTRAFLRWAGVNILLGAWDNYWGTPSNYHLYNSGRAGAAGDFMGKPYFHWIPWDYDNALGIDRFDTQWQYVKLLDWETATRNYHRGDTSKLPLITNMLKNPAYVRYYLDHIEYMLDNHFNEAAISKHIGDEDSRAGVWQRIRKAAFLESDGPANTSHTGRQFTNDQIFWNGYKGDELSFAGAKITGILHFVRMRHDRAREELRDLRRTHPRGASGATFPESLAAIPR